MREKKNRWLYLIFLLIAIILIIIGASFLILKDTKREISEQPKQEIEKEVIDEKQQESKKIEDNEETKIENESNTSKQKTETKDNNKQKQETKKEENTVIPKEDKQEPTINNDLKDKPKEENKSPSSNEKEGPWTALGITEDQYYNKPMYNWESVDFNSMSECLSYGDNYEPYLNGEELYNCREVKSFSGKFLGVMFDTEKLN